MTPILLALLGIAQAAGTAADGWVPAGRTVDGVAAIHLQKTFGKKSGTFKSVPESMLEKEGTLSGEFLLGTWRFTYQRPIRELGVTFDELVTVDVLDCRRSYFGTLRRTQKLKGRVVADEVTKDRDLVLTQITSPTVDAQLCDVHAGKPPRASR